MNKIKIGITDCSKYANYEQWFLHAPEDVEVIRLSYKKNNLHDVEQCDGIVLSGGEDVHPRRYNKPELMRYLNTNDIDEERDEFEWQVIDKGMQMHKPFLGICRGLQKMNVFLGGTLIHDIPTVKLHHGHHKIDNVDQRHHIAVNENSMLCKIASNKDGVVNTAHHQSVDAAAESLTVTAFSEPSIVEAMEWKEPLNKPWLLLVQWHPERMPDQENPFASNIREAFLRQIIQSK